MARAVGLDIGSRMIKVVELVGGPRAFRIQRVITRPIPEPDLHPPEGEIPQNPDELISDAIRDIFQTLKLPKDDVCASFDSGTTIFREIIVPFLEDDQIRKVVRFEAENHLHSQAIDDVIVNWVKTGESKDGSRLTIFASPKAGLRRLLDILRGAGIEPSSVDLDTTALYTAYDTAGVLAENPNAILIDVGARSTSLILVAEGRPVVLRAFLLGTDQVEAGVSKELQVPLAEGRRRARLPSGAHSDDLLVPAADLAPATPESDKSLERIQSDVAVDLRATFVRKLHREAIRSLGSLPEDAAPARILLSGGGSLLPGLDAELEDKFGLPVERVDLSRYVEWKDQGSDPEFTLASTPAAVGCGLRILGHDPLGVELLKEEYAPTNRFDVIKGALATLVTLLFVILLGLAYVATKQKSAEQSRYRHVSGRAALLFQAAEIRYRTDVENKTEEEARTQVRAWRSRQPQDHTVADKYASRLRSRFRRLESELGLGDIPQVPSALKVWLEVYRALGKLPRGDYGAWFRILKLDIKPRNATVRIEVDEKAALDKIRRQLEESPYFKERARNPGRVVELGPAKPERGHWQRDFELKFKEDD